MFEATRLAKPCEVCRQTITNYLAVLEATIRYWRDKAHREVDFVLAGKGRDPVAIECKWTAERFEADGIAAFRKLHPNGKNVVVAHDVKEPYEKEMGGNRIRFVGLEALIEEARD